MEEKRGGRNKLDKESNNLKEYIQSNWLIDTPFNNGLFTWNNKRAGSHQIASRLDRFLISDNAIHLEGDLSASILPLAGSDHWPISLEWSQPGNATRRPFRFETFCMTHPDFINLAQTALDQDMKQLQQRIITEGRSEELSKQEKSLETQISERAKQEETLWRQKSRIGWLKEGEKNTKKFHRSTIQRRMNNNITHIQNEQGVKVEKHEEIELELLNYFKQAH
eukprot:PITA_28043